MSTANAPSDRRNARPLVSGAVFLAFVLVASAWVASTFSAEARVRRATARMVDLVEKEGEESPVSLGLSANRLGKLMATNAVLEAEDYGPLATGRADIVQVFAMVRDSLSRIELSDPEIATARIRDGEVAAAVEVRYRLVPKAGGAAEGEGRAELRWNKGQEGWQVSHALLKVGEGASLPEGWR